MGRSWRLLAVLMTLAAVTLAGCSADRSGEDSAMDAGDDVAESDEAAGADADSDDSAGDDGAGQALPAGSRDIDGTHVIRNGWMTIVYGDSFDDAFGEVSRVAERLDGGVSGVTSETLDDGATVGEVAVRVPVDAYDQLLLEVAGIGEVVSREVSEEDVSGEVVDLRSRLRHLERQEEFYLGLMDDADDVSDAITIQEHLEGVQSRKEEVQGRLDHLGERTQTSTLRVRLVPEGHEGDGLPVATAGFAGYWDQAVDAFVRVAGTLLVFFVGGAPLLLVAAAALAAAAALVRALRVRGAVQGSDGSASMTRE